MKSVMLMPKTFKVILEPQPEGGYTAFVPELPDVISEGETKEEAVANIKDAIEGYVQTMKEMGWPLPVVEEVTVDVQVA